MATYFAPAALKFLRGLKRHNDRDWFNERKAIYEQQLKEPLLALIDEVNTSLEQLAPEHIRPPAKSMMRIYRDTRFSNNKLPYKPHIAAWWGREGMVKTSGAGFYLQITGTEVLLGAGLFMPDRDQLLAIRRYLLEHGGELRTLLADPALLAAMQPVDGEKLSRAPKGFPADHPALDLIVARRWGVSTKLPAEAALNPDFSEEIVRHFLLAVPLVATLNRAFAPAARKTLF